MFASVATVCEQPHSEVCHAGQRAREGTEAVIWQQLGAEDNVAMLDVGDTGTSEDGLAPVAIEAQGVDCKVAKLTGG